MGQGKENMKEEGLEDQCAALPGLKGGSSSDAAWLSSSGQWNPQKSVWYGHRGKLLMPLWLLHPEYTLELARVKIYQC